MTSTLRERTRPALARTRAPAPRASKSKARFYGAGVHLHAPDGEIGKNAQRHRNFRRLAGAQQHLRLSQPQHELQKHQKHRLKVGFVIPD